MRSKILQHFVLILVALLVLSLFNIAGAADMSSSNAIDDGTITTTVKSKIQKDKSLNDAKIDVDTSNGEVTLQGKAATRADKERAAQLASSVDGVKKVDNNLQTPSCPIGANWEC